MLAGPMIIAEVPRPVEQADVEPVPGFGGEAGGEPEGGRDRGDRQRWNIPLWQHAGKREQHRGDAGGQDCASRPRDYAGRPGGDT